MIILCTCPPRSKLHITDLGLSVKGKKEPTVLVPGDEMELAETDAVVLSRYHGEIYRFEQKGWLAVKVEPTKVLFSPS